MAIEITFHNVEITFEAANADEAYARLCEALASVEAEWQTDTYSQPHTVTRPTRELFARQELKS
jgi:hypothetical protein